MRRKTLSIAEVSDVAASFQSRSDFARQAQCAYQYAWRRGLLDQVCSHMVDSPVYSRVRWSESTAACEAKKYISRAEFKRECSGAYMHLLAAGRLDHACGHMDVGQFKWHPFAIRVEAAKYTAKLDFKRGSPGAFKAAVDLGIMEQVCAGMRARTRWNKEKALLRAASFRTISEFQEADRGAYNHLRRHKLLDQACAHMDPGVHGFSKTRPAHLYYFRITLCDGAVFFKIGITNRQPHQRASCLGLPPGASCEIIDAMRFDDGREARMAEKAFHAKFRPFKYRGAPILKNGNTELFTADVLPV